MKSKPPIDRLPPHSYEAEQGVLSCMLQSPNGCITQAETKLGRNGEPFYDLRHQVIFQKIIDLHDRNTPVDTITLRQELMDGQRLEEVGGTAYIAALPGLEALPSNLGYYLGIVHDKFTLRRLIHAATDAVGRIYDYEGDVQSLVTTTQRDLLSILNPLGTSTTQEHWRMQDLIGYDVDKDPNAVVGWHDGKTTRYLCRGYSAWIIGQSGIGKSTLGQQQAYMWALGKPFCGIMPVRPLRILIVQNENDQGDCAEATQGILDCAAFTPEEFDLLNQRVKIIRCRGKTGPDFCRWLEREVAAWKADLVYVDPLLRFAGIDVSRQDQCTKFLNDSLDPVLANTGVVMIGAHHTGKPKSKKETQGWTIYDYAYAGIGSSELVNWARAISIIQVIGDGNFEILLAKRGARAWATHPEKIDPTTSIFMKHAVGKIFWVQIEPPPPIVKKDRATGKTGRPNKVDEIAASNLHEFCAGCKPEGEGQNEISRRLMLVLAKNKIDASLNTCKRIIQALVANEKLSKSVTDLAVAYLKGPNA